MNSSCACVRAYTQAYVPHGNQRLVGGAVGGWICVSMKATDGREEAIGFYNRKGPYKLSLGRKSRPVNSPLEK